MEHLDGGPLSRQALNAARMAGSNSAGASGRGTARSNSRVALRR